MDFSATSLRLKNGDGYWATYLHNEDRSVLSSMLNDYVCNVEPWSEKLPTDLMIDAKDLVDEGSDA